MPHSQKFVWVVVHDENGKRLLCGPYTNEAHAESRAERFGEIQLVATLPTRDDASAARMIKHELGRTDKLSHGSN